MSFVGMFVDTQADPSKKSMPNHTKKDRHNQVKPGIMMFQSHMVQFARKAGSIQGSDEKNESSHSAWQFEIEEPFAILQLIHICTDSLRLSVTTVVFEDPF